MRNLIQDIRFSIRQFLKRPGFTVTAIVILALGLGANTAIFSVVNAFLLRPLPFKDPDRLVSLFERDVVGTEPFNSIAPGSFFDWQEQATSFESLGGFFTGPMNFSIPGSAQGAQRIEGCACSASVFSMLGIAPALGRTYTTEEDIYAPRHLVVISYNLWQSRFGGSRDVIGKEILVDAEKMNVIGVMPRGFAFPWRNVDAWEPFMTYMPPDRHIRHDNHYILAMGRLKPGVTVEQARAEVDGITARYHQAHPNDPVGKGANAVTLKRGLLAAAAYMSGSDVRMPLLMLLGAVFLVLMIACVNVANLLLTRAMGRSREVAIRAALGATRARIARQLLTESILLSVFGAIVGLLAATSMTEFLAAHAPGAEYVLPTGDLPVDRAVYLFTFGVALLTGIVAGLFPAFQSSRTDLVHGLRDSSRSVTPGRAHGHFRSLLVVAEVALSVVLLASAGLLIHSFSQLYRVNPGMRIDHTLTMGTYFPNVGYRENAQRAAFLKRLVEEMHSIPGVIDAGLVTCLPLGGHCSDRVFTIEGRMMPAGQMMDAVNRAADPGYFQASGIPLLRGRVFTAHDGAGTDPQHLKISSMVVSESFAQKFFPGEDPVGKRLVYGNNRDRRFEIVGVVGDVLTGLDQKAEPTMYEPIFDGTWDETFIVLHTARDPRGVFTAVREDVNKLDPLMAIYQVRTMEEAVGLSTADRKFSMLLFSTFAGLAVVLAAVGVYGVLSFAVSQRKGEIGVRMALGASASDVSRLILRQGMKPAIVGIVVGMIGAALASQVLKSLLFGVAPSDPVTFAAVPVLLGVTAMLACYLPAWRASRIDPTQTLRAE